MKNYRITRLILIISVALLGWVSNSMVRRVSAVSEKRNATSR
jgi:hypothetical protein